MTAQDIRVGRWDLHATAGDQPSIVTTWADEAGDAYSLTGKAVSMFIGGTVTDPSDTAGATEVVGTIATNTATFAPTIPTTLGSTPLRVTVDGTVRSLGSLIVSGVGSGSPDLDVTVNVAPISFDVTLSAPSGVLFTQHDANVSHPRPDTVGPVVWVGSVTPVYAQADDIVMFVDDQAAMPTVAWLAAFTADSLAATLVEAAAVSTWADVSGNSHDLTQATAGLRPVWHEAAGAVPAYVTFASDAMASAALATNADQPITYVALVRPSSVSTASGTVRRVISGLNPTDNVQLSQRGDAGSVARWHMFAGTSQVTTTITATTDWAVIVAYFNAGASYIRVNGVQETLATVGTNQLTGWTVGSNVTQDGSFLAGDIADFRVFEGTLTAAERTAVEVALADKAGITLP